MHGSSKLRMVAREWMTGSPLSANDAIGAGGRGERVTEEGKGQDDKC